MAGIFDQNLLKFTAVAVVRRVEVIKLMYERSDPVWRNKL
jgi:hypothetical protein